MGDQRKASSTPQLGDYGIFNLHLAGLAAQLSWLYLLLYSGGWNSAVSFTRAYGTADPLYYVSAAALCATLLFGAFRTKRFMEFARCAVMQIAAPLAAAVGTLLYCLITTENTAFALCGGLLTGFGSAMLWTRWAAAFGRYDSRTVIGMGPLIIGATVLVCFSVGYLDATLQALVVIALPVASGIWLAVADSAYRKSIEHSKEAGAQPADDPLPHHASHASKRSYPVLIAFASFLGFTTGILPAFSLGNAETNYDLLFYSGIALITVVFLALAIFMDDRKNFPLLFAFPMVVTFCILLPFASSGSSGLLQALAPLGCIAFELFLLIGSVIFARTVDYSPARVYIITRLFMTLFDSIGLACGNLVVGQTAENIAMQFAAIVLFLIIEVFVALLAFAYFKARKGSLGQRGAKASVPNTDTTASIAATATDASPAPAVSDVDEPAPAPQEEPAKEPTLAEQCQLIGERFGLSARELDVLELVAQGCTYARIREALTISQGTVNYHMSNLYAKLGVHSRQEVIDLVRAQEQPGA